MKPVRNILIIGAIVLSLIPGARAQETAPWSLEKCIEYAHTNNITIKQQELNSMVTKNNLKQRKASALPSLNANANYNLGFGRVPDETNYDFHNGTTQRGNAGLSTSMPLFEGFQKKNAIKKSYHDYLAAIEHLQTTKNDISLELTSYFLQVLFDKELLIVANEQLETTTMQVERTGKLVDAGSQALGSLLEIKSQEAKEALNVTQQRNALSLSLLNLAQLLDLENPTGFDIEKPQLPDMGDGTLSPPDNIYNSALTIMPQIKGAEYKLKSSEYELQQAVGTKYPSLTLNSGLTSSVSKYEGESDFSFKEKFNDNLNAYIGLNLRIPIFNGLQSKTYIQNTRINVLDSKYQLEKEKLTLRKEIQQAYADAMASYKKYLASQTAVESFKESFKYTEKKFNVGLVNSVDYNVAKTDLIKSQSNFIQSKYEYILRTKILDFYKGIPISL